MEHAEHAEHAEGLLTPEDIAKRLTVSRNMVYDLVRRGELPGVRVGRRVRVTEQDLQAFITRSRARRA